ncbi:MAG: alpha/beta hydrolase [Planctomycetota bacterium]|nr:alpha/beta hydrolase [Planctomycetota bacterium]
MPSHQVRALQTKPLRSARADGGALVRLLGALLLLLVIAGIGISRGVGSLAPAEVQRRILQLPKNAAFREALVTGRSTASGDPVLAAHFPRSAEGGEPARPIVLVHGTPDTMGAWAPLLFGPGSIAGQADVWTLEVVGHGMLGDAAGPFPFQRCADHVAASLDALGLSGVTLVGNSYGGEFCWRVAADRPDLVERLVLIDCSGLPRSDDEFLPEEVKMREWSVARLGYLLNSEDRVAFALDPHFDGAADDGRVREVFLGLENRTNWGAMIDLVRDENGARAGDLEGIAAPTLLVFGELDQAYSPAAFGAEFARRIPDARLEVIEGAGHYPHEQEPALVGELLLDFHRGAPTRPGAR